MTQFSKSVLVCCLGSYKILFLSFVNYLALIPLRTQKLRLPFDAGNMADVSSSFENLECCIAKIQLNEGKL